MQCSAAQPLGTDEALNSTHEYFLIYQQPYNVTNIHSAEPPCALYNKQEFHAIYQDIIQSPRRQRDVFCLKSSQSYSFW